jgi:hypothetical protein
MRTFACVAAIVLVLCALASAQMQLKPMVIPNHEISVGYAYMNTTTSGPSVNSLIGFDRTDLNGLAFSYSQYFASKLGVTLELYHGSNSKADRTGIQYSSSSYSAGPTYRLYQHNFWLASVHALVGIEHSTFTIPNVNNTDVTNYYRDWDIVGGGGVTVDGNLTRHVAVRLAQVDYRFSNHYNSSQSGIRIISGLALRF